MLSQINRLQKNGDFAKTFRFGKGFYAGKLNLKVVANPKISNCRFGYVISNKIDKRATRRNALKRRLRSATREFSDRISGASDVVVVVKQNYPWPYNYSEIKGDLEKALGQAGVISKN